MYDYTFRQKYYQVYGNRLFRLFAGRLLNRMGLDRWGDFRAFQKLSEALERLHWQVQLRSKG